MPVNPYNGGRDSLPWLHGKGDLDMERALEGKGSRGISFTQSVNHRLSKIKM